MLYIYTYIGLFPLPTTYLIIIIITIGGARESRGELEVANGPVLIMHVIYVYIYIYMICIYIYIYIHMESYMYIHAVHIYLSLPRSLSDLQVIKHVLV